MPMPEPIRLGTRASALARTQSATVGDALAAVAGRPWQEVLVRTHGDDQSVSLTAPGRPGLFVSALRDALLAGEVDVIVHSYKDLPSAPVPGITLAAVPSRADARDALVSRDGLRLVDLPAGAVVGTSSPRRTASLQRIRPDLDVRPIRGNVDSRIAKVRAGEYDAAVLAVAGLDRIGRAAEITEVLDAVLPAPAQGALAVECRSGDDELRGWLALLDDPVSRLVTSAERAVLVGISAACSTAIAAAGSWDGTELRLRAELTVAGRDTTADVGLLVDPGSDAAGRVLAARAAGLRAAGVLLGATDDRPPVLLVRADTDDPDREALAAFGIPAISDPHLRKAARRDDAGLEHLLALLADPAPGTWLIATSPSAVPALAAAVGERRLTACIAAAVAAGARAAATGERTANTLRDAGFADVAMPAAERSSASGLLDLLAAHDAGSALLPLGAQALRTIPDGLRSRGWQVHETVVYDTEEALDRPPSALLLEAGQVSAVVLRSPSAVRAVLRHARPAESVHVVCAGPTTARAASAAGLRVSAVSLSPDPAALAVAVRTVLEETGP
jgi:hydroxymethylbilane synthase